MIEFNKDGLDIPDFLRRDKNEKPTPVEAVEPVAPPPDPVQEKWRQLEAQRKEQKKVKARGRVGKMLAKKADQAAVAAGKRWNAIKGVWEGSDG